MELINVELINEVKEHLEQMQEITDSFKGNKKPLEARISVFKRLLEAYRSASIDVYIKDADKAKTDISTLLMLNELEDKATKLKKREAFIDEFGGGISTDQVEKIIKALI